MSKDQGVDILGFDTVSGCENAQPMELLAADGMTKIGISLMVLGSHADVVKKHFKDKAKRFMTSSAMAEKQGKQDQFTEKLVDAKETNEIEGAAVRVTGWVGVKQDFSQDLLKQALTKNPHWIEQVVKFSENVGNFT